MRHFVPLTLTFAALVLLGDAANAQNLLIHGGRIHTGTDDKPTVEAVAVRNGRIIYTGTLEGSPRDGLDVIDLKGATLFAGFTDAHAHINGIGWRESTLNLEGSASLAEAMQCLSDWSRTHPQGVVSGRGWIETRWPEGRIPTAADLDAAAPGRIVLLTRADGHAIVVSTPALEAAGITAQTQAPPGGEILRNTDGSPSGLLVDAAEQLVAALAPQASSEATASAYRTGMAVYARYGWTGAHYMSVPVADLSMLETMAENGQVPIRLYNYLVPEGLDMLAASGPRSVADGRVITAGVKMLVDGALGSRGAALFAPYSDAPHTSGLMQASAEEWVPLFRTALKHKVQLAIHAIGDRGNFEVADWYRQAMESVPRDQWGSDDPRWRIEHAQIVRPQDYSLFTALGAIASMQPSHAIGDLHFAQNRLGVERLNGAYAWKSLSDLGVVVAGGSDAPVERGDPLIEFYAAVARRDLDGFQGENWHPEEAVSRQTALKMFTLWPAYASFREDEPGTIEPGKRADFTAFDIDLMTVPAADIPHGRAVLTIVDGKVVYQAD